MKHNYPKHRKPRNTDYSITSKLIKEFGEKRLYEIWCDCNGMYGASDYLSELTDVWITPWIVRYLSEKFNWKRKMTDKDNAVYKAVVINKSVPAEYYKHLEFF